MTDLLSSSTTNDKCKKHCKQLEMICISCSIFICTKCILEHNGHSVKDVEDYYDEIKQTAGHLFTETKEKSKSISDYFELEQCKFNELEVKHNDQIQYISKQFSLLHDALHIKEVQIKRELKSYHDNNQESFIIKRSEIENTLNFIYNSLLMAKESGTNLSPNLTDKVQFINLYQSLKSNNNIFGNNQPISYQQVSVTQNNFSKLELQIESFQLNDSYNPPSPPKIVQIVHQEQQKELEQLSLLDHLLKRELIQQEQIKLQNQLDKQMKQKKQQRINLLKPLGSTNQKQTTLSQIRKKQLTEPEQEKKVFGYPIYFSQKNLNK